MHDGGLLVCQRRDSGCCSWTGASASARKFCVTGNGRCNLTNRRQEPECTGERIRRKLPVCAVGL